MSGDHEDAFYAATANAADAPTFIDSSYADPSTESSYHAPRPQQPTHIPQPAIIDAPPGDPFYEPQLPSQDHQPKTKAFWKLQFWQQYFNIDTADVATRCLGVVLFWRPPDFLAHKCFGYYARQSQENQSGGLELDGAGGPPYEPPSPPSGNPEADLYGPFWLCATLWIALAVVANVSKALACQHAVDSQQVACEDSWFNTLGAAGATIYGYGTVVPLALWLVMKYKDVPVGLIDTICLYGYSFFPFCIAAILCLIPISLFQWVIAFTACALSTAYILFNLLGVWKQNLDAKWFAIVTVGAMACHIGLILVFKLWFFQVIISVPTGTVIDSPSSPGTVIPTTTSPSGAAAGGVPAGIPAQVATPSV